MILITRPYEDSITTAKELQKMGIDSLVAPLFSTEITANPSFNPNDYDVFIFTSKNAIRAYGHSYEIVDKQIFTIGLASATLAADYGFRRIIRSESDVNDLIHKIKSNIFDKNLKLVHFCGEETIGDVCKSLNSAEINCHREIVYKKIPIKALPTQLIDNIDEVDGVMFFSPQTAEIFCKLIAQFGLSNFLMNYSAYCISANTAEKLTGTSWKNISIANEPNQVALINRIAENYNAQPKS